MHNEQDYWYLLLELDNSWELIDDDEEFIFRNAAGQEVHANTLMGALQGALALYGQMTGRTGI